MQVLPWHIAYLTVVVTGNVAMALAHAGWSLAPQLALTMAVPAALAILARLLHGRRARG